MQVVYEPWLVLLSIVMAIQGAYVGFTLTSQLGAAVGVRRRVLLAGAAFSLAVAIWTMHFVGMLAARISFPIDYLVFPTLLSLLVCVLVVGVAVFAISSGPVSLPRLFLSACLMGAGIFSMHYIGMTALHASAHMEHAPFLVMASLVIAIVASGSALWLATGEVRRPPLILSSVAFGIAVSGMHYTAMAGMKLFPLPATTSAPALSTDLLAIVVAVVAFCVSGIFLLVLVPDRTRGEFSPVKAAPEPAQSLQVAGASVAPVQSVESKDYEGQFGRGTYAPLGGAGKPPPRIAQHLPSSGTARRNSSLLKTLSPFTPTLTTHMSSTAASSCFVRWRSAKWNRGSTRTGSFASTAATSSTSIGLLGIDETAIARWSELTASDHYSVPVSRSRIGWLKSRINAARRLRPITSAVLTQFVLPFVQSRCRWCRRTSHHKSVIAAASRIRHADCSQWTGRPLQGPQVGRKPTGQGLPGGTPMIPGSFAYHRPSSVKEAVGLLGSLGDDARAIAGGHSLIPMMKLRLASPAHLIDLAGVADLKGIREDGKDIVIGAMTTQHELIGSDLLSEKIPMLARNRALIADPQVRYVGTIGGNVANGDPGNDMPAVMMCLNATYHAVGKRRAPHCGARVLPGRLFHRAGARRDRDRHPHSGARRPGTAMLTKSSSARSATMRQPPRPSC